MIRFIVRRYVAADQVAETWAVSLPHQCQEWGITNDEPDLSGVGYAEAVQALADFHDALDRAMRRLIEREPDETIRQARR
jgi:hypothetical protein